MFNLLLVEKSIRIRMQWSFQATMTHRHARGRDKFSACRYSTASWCHGGDMVPRAGRGRLNSTLLTGLLAHNISSHSSLILCKNLFQGAKR